MGANINLTGRVSQASSMAGVVSVTKAISGAVSSASDVRELHFGNKDTFPSVGSEWCLYIDTVDNAVYRWDGNEYLGVSIDDQIDDESIGQQTTWSSTKLDMEFALDRTKIDRINIPIPMTNMEVQEILNS